MTYRDELEAAQARADAAERENDELREALAERAPVVPIPERFRVLEVDEVFTASWRLRPLDRQLAFLFVFTMFWIGFLVIWFMATTNAPVFFRIFVAPFVLIGAVLLYAMVAHAVDRVTLRADRHGVTVRVGPLPWIGGTSLERSDLTRISAGDRQNLFAIDRAGREQTLVTLETHSEARYLEGALQRHFLKLT